ncbi:MAG TPA: hypothetical protein VFW52_02515 [Candidatus Saccharimonadales bacterium]|nr:hypothetical protein [Candidatus Saccharimonadales bacterium]
MKQKLIKSPTKLNELNFDDLYEEISKDWQSKSHKLQDRRWQQITHNKDESDTNAARHVAGTKLWLIRI